MEPGASRPKPSCDPSAPVDDAEIERTLRDVESITSTLVQEVGRPPNLAAEAEARAAAAAEPTGPATAEAAPPPDDPASSVDTIAQDLPAAADAPPQELPSTEVAAAEKQPSTQDGSPVSPANPAAELPSAEAVASATEEPDTGSAAPAVTQPTSEEPQPEAASCADAEVEQEISQAIRDLQAGQHTPAPATAVDDSDTDRPRPSIPRRILLALDRGADAVLAPLALLTFAMDLPFRWMPARVKHLLGYVAVGTTLMAGALWYYIIAVRPH